MFSNEKRIARLEQIMEAHASRRNCEHCGPEALIILWRMADGQLRLDGTNEIWPTDATDAVHCPRCGDVPALQVVILSPNLKPDNPSA